MGREVEAEAALVRQACTSIGLTVSAWCDTNVANQAGNICRQVGKCARLGRVQVGLVARVVRATLESWPRRCGWMTDCAHRQRPMRTFMGSCADRQDGRAEFVGCARGTWQVHVPSSAFMHRASR
ncbi:hypothetical protein Salat_1173500 [Sesamum alatum]|uniref:Uncharacterized protein n=1 Tax=Sesamum alatum TaxID=300844 RepID=A0AAE2CNJ8_9LAMI|nr:hypothetical protein Salat_1173500 [Sesamum alatum]